jgi:replicative DNA helicase
MIDLALEEISSPSTSAIPHNREAEEAVIGAVLIHPDVYYNLVQFLLPDDFYIVRHRWIWEAFHRLHEKKMPVDFLTVTETLEGAGQLAEIGGPAYLTALVNQVPTSLHAEAYGHLVSDEATRRRLLQAANQIATLAYDRSLDLPESAEQSIAALEKAVAHPLQGSLAPICETLRTAYDRIEILSRSPELPGIASGLEELDTLLGNFQPGNFYVLAARPGLGKSALLLNIAHHAAKQNNKVALFSLEMPKEQLTIRLLAQESGLNSQLIGTGKLAGGDWGKLTAAMEALEPLPIFMDDSPAITPTQLKAMCRRLHMTAGKPDLILVDYLQLMTAGAHAETRAQEVGYISRSLKALAKELGAPVLAAAQLNREVEKRATSRPQLSDLRESGDIEADADVVMFLYSTEENLTLVSPVETQLLVAKHRGGPVGELTILFKRETSRFLSA